MSDNGEEQSEVPQENHHEHHNHIDHHEDGVAEVDPELAALLEAKRHKAAEEAEAMKEAAADLRAEIEVEEKEIAVLKEKQV